MVLKERQEEQQREREVGLLLFRVLARLPLMLQMLRKQREEQEWEEQERRQAENASLRYTVSLCLLLTAVGRFGLPSAPASVSRCAPPTNGLYVRQYDR